MPKFKFSNFQKGWFHDNPHLVGLDGFNSVNNFVLYKHGIEKIRGWKKLNLIPANGSIDSFPAPAVIDDFNTIIDNMT